MKAQMEKIDIGSPRLCVSKRSATVPPTRVEPVDAATPPMKRAMITVACVACARSAGDSLICSRRKPEEGLAIFCPYAVGMKKIVYMSEETTYRG